MSVREIYKDSEGNRLPSVTTILSRFKDSGGLLYWANQQGLAGKTLDEARMPAASAGTLAHDMVEASLNKRPLPDGAGVAADVVAKAKAAFQTYLAWQEMTKIVVRHTEVSLVSEAHGFGGRLDAIGMMGNQLVLIDWKTSNAVYADHLLQLAGYKTLWEETYPDQLLTGGFHLCRFAKEEGDFSHHYFPNLDKEAAAFLLMRDLYGRMKQIEKRVK